jgi:soluble lytic murein transglycosylase-like protein
MQSLLREAHSLSALVNRMTRIPEEFDPVASKHPLSLGPTATYGGIIARAAEEYRISPHLIAAVIKCESNWLPRATSRVGARGLMQIMPRTAKGEFGVEAHKLWDPHTNIQVGTAYLRTLANRYRGNPVATIYAYNAGPGRLESGKPIPLETRRYSSCVHRWFSIYRERQK